MLHISLALVQLARFVQIFRNSSSFPCFTDQISTEYINSLSPIINHPSNSLSQHRIMKYVFIAVIFIPKLFHIPYLIFLICYWLSNFFLKIYLKSSLHSRMFEVSRYRAVTGKTSYWLLPKLLYDQ